MNILFLTALASLFYLIPLVIGRGILTALWRSKKEETLADLPSYFVIGTAIIFVVALISQYVILPLYPTASFKLLFFDSVYSITGLMLVLNALKFKSLLRLFRVKVLAVVALTLFFSSVSYSVWTWKSPYSLNWDLYEHQTLVHLITEGHFSFFTSKISDTFGFNSYPPVFHLLMAVSQFPAALRPDQIIIYWNVIGFIHLWIVSLISYAFAYTVTKNKGLSVLSSLIGTLTFESVIAFTSFFLLPQTLAAVVFMAAFTALIWRKKNYLSLSPIEVICAVVLLGLLHYVIGGLAAVILLGTFVYFAGKHQFDQLTHQLPLNELLILAVLGGFFATQFIDLSALNHGEAASYIFTLPQKFTFMLQSYGLFLVSALPIGILDAIKATNWLKKYLLFVLFCFLMLFMSQLPYVLKFFVLGRWFILFFASLGIWNLIDKQTFALSRKISVGIVFVGLIVILILNSLLWKQGLTTDNQISHVSQDELAAAQFLKDNYSTQSILIISDPATQYILEALGGANSPGGSFANQTTRETLNRALHESSSDLVANDLKHIQDSVTSKPEKTFVIYSGRLFLWERATDTQKYSFEFNIWESRQLKFSDYQWLNQLNPAQFPLIYQNSSLEIRELR